MSFKALPAPPPVLVGVLVPSICGPQPKQQKPRLADPWLEYLKKRRKLARAYGLPEESPDEID